MAKLVTLLEQHLDRQPPTVVTQATTWWETVLAHVKLQESGLGVHLPVNVCLYCFYIHIVDFFIGETFRKRLTEVFRINFCGLEFHGPETQINIMNDRLMKFA